MHHQQQSPLLQLPAELQLTIFEYAVLEPEPLLLNCGCDSSYSGDHDQWREDRQLWETGERLPPLQPGLTKTCSLIRSLTIPIFYQQNVFRAHYCHRSDFETAVKWLNLIGKDNRLLLRDLCLWDWNTSFDWQMPSSLRLVNRSEIFRGMGGSMESLGRETHCCHRITFGDEDEDYVGLVPWLFGE